MSVAVLVEHAGGKLLPHSLSTLTAAKLLGRVTAVVAGGPSAALDSASKAAAGTAGVDEVLVAGSPALEHNLAEPHSALLQLLQASRGFSHIVGSASAHGKNVLPRAAALLGVQAVSDVVEVVDKDTFRRPVYAGNAFATVKCGSTPSAPRVLSVRPTSFAPAAVSPSALAPVSAVDEAVLQGVAKAAATSRSQWVGKDARVSARPELGSAKVVVCGGRALKSSENFGLLEQLADLLGGAVGATRAAVDAGYVPNDLQVGQTGKVVAPQLYLGIGVSGAIQHLAGMKDSKTIVAINNDPEAPLFQVADYGLQQDLFKAIPELIEEIKKAGIKPQA